MTQVPRREETKGVTVLKKSVTKVLLDKNKRSKNPHRDSSQSTSTLFLPYVDLPPNHHHGPAGHLRSSVHWYHDRRSLRGPVGRLGGKGMRDPDVTPVLDWEGYDTFQIRIGH